MCSRGVQRFAVAAAAAAIAAFDHSCKQSSVKREVQQRSWVKSLLLLLLLLLLLAIAVACCS
jgi:ABC-type phosphate transport system permease subunit